MDVRDLLAAEVLAAELAPAGNPALEDGPECIGVDRAGEPELFKLARE